MCHFLWPLQQHLNTTDTYTEPELVALLRQRSPVAFEYLYLHYSGALLSVICTMVQEPQAAEDVLQEVFIRIFRKTALYNAEKSRLYTWMAQIARNIAIDWSRKTGRQPAAINPKQPEDVSVVTAGIDIDSSDLWQWVNKLEKPEREVVILSYLWGHTQESISEQLQVPLGTVKSRTKSGLNKLRQLMSEVR